MNSAISIENRPFRARLLAAFWSVETGVGLAFAVAGVSRVSAGENGVAGVLIVSGLLLSIVGIIMAATCWRAARIKGAVLIIGPQGLLDRRICNQVIPWNALSWKIIFNGRAFALQFNVAEPERSGLKVNWEQRAMSKFHKLFNYPEFSVASLGTGRNIHELGDIITRFKLPVDGVR